MITSSEIHLKEKSQISGHRELCLKCFRPIRACFCGILKPFKTNTRFCILMHPLEAKRSQIGTGRLSHLGLINSEIIIDKDFDLNPRFNKIINDDSYEKVLLYPGKEAICLDSQHNELKELTTKKPLLIFVLDGTWPCAKSMMRDTKKLHLLPKVCFKQKYRSQFDIKHQPADYCLSTIESIHHVITALEDNKIEEIENDKKQSLLDSFNEMVRFHKNVAQDPTNNNYHRSSGPVKKENQRIRSKKWDKRKICFNS